MGVRSVSRLQLMAEDCLRQAESDQEVEETLARLHAKMTGALEGKLPEGEFALLQVAVTRRATGSETAEEKIALQQQLANELNAARDVVLEERRKPPLTDEERRKAFTPTQLW